MTQEAAPIAHTNMRANTDLTQASPMASLALKSMFWRPSYLAISAWLEHIPFAFWLTEAHQPLTFVELGTHFGASYFAFCQAVERLGLPTRCFAVDTWQGDDHAGAYAEEVFAQVSAHNEALYSSFSQLLRSTFDDSLQYFEDGSIDLLHIDGLHTYEAVRDDFNKWQPKLSSRAIVIMHDTNVRERDFGVFKLLAELKARYPYFEFLHGHGLGVVGVGDERQDIVQALFAAQANPTTMSSVQEVFSRLGRACADAWSVRDSQARLQTADAASKSRELSALEKYALERGQLAERITLQHEQIVDFEQRATSELNQLAELTLHREQQAASLNELTEQYKQLSAQNEQLLQQLEAREECIRGQNNLLKSLQQELAQQEQARELRELAYQSSMQRAEELEQLHRESEVSSRQTTAKHQAELQEQQLRLAQSEQQIAGLQVALARQHEQNNALTVGLEERIAELAAAQEAAAKQDARGLELQLRLAQVEQQAAQAQADHAAESSALQSASDQLNKQNKELETSVEERFRELAALTRLLEQKEIGLQFIQEQLRQAKESNKKIKNSVSWRLTAPIRSISLPSGRASTRQRRDIETIRQSGLFNQQWYLAQYPEVSASGVDPVEHYLLTGAASGLKPSPGFDTLWYVRTYPDVGASGMNPLLHFIRHGQAENRTPLNTK